ncbi:MAG: hypothetical protein ACKVT2_02400 [Saprospiraceae bacterium]
MTTKKMVAGGLLSYLEGETTLSELIDWAETTLLEGDFADSDLQLLTEALGKIGLADVRNFGLAWEDCEAMLHKLGYRVEMKMRALA